MDPIKSLSVAGCIYLYMDYLPKAFLEKLPLQTKGIRGGAVRRPAVQYTGHGSGGSAVRGPVVQYTGKGSGGSPGTAREPHRV